MGEAELHRSLLDALREVLLVEREPELPVLEDVVGTGFVVASARRLLHSLLPPTRASPAAGRECFRTALPGVAGGAALNAGLHPAGRAGKRRRAATARRWRWSRRWRGAASGRGVCGSWKPKIEPGPGSRAWRLRRLRTRAVLGHRVAVADGHLSRLLGLALLRRRRAGPGLLLPGCRAIHTVGMLFRLDVTFLDADCRELRCEQEVGFGRWLNEPNAAAVLELPSGAGAREPSLPRSRRRRSATVRGRP